MFRKTSLMLTRISARLVIVLAIIAAVTATGFVAGYKMQAFVVAYWVVVTCKYIFDYIAMRLQSDCNTSKGDNK